MISEALSVTSKHIQSEGVVEEHEASYRLRHEVYCNEKKFLDGPVGSGRESDEYDEFSEHFVVLHDGDEESDVVGTARLVRYSDTKGFPTACHYPKLYDHLSQIHYDELGEISRLCMTKKFRRRKNACQCGPGDYEEEREDRRRYPFILLHLYKKIYLCSKEMGIRYWLATMEDSLCRALSRYSIRFQPLIDDYIDYYGKVKPYIAKIADLENIMASSNKELFQFFTS